MKVNSSLVTDKSILWALAIAANVLRVPAGRDCETRTLILPKIKRGLETSNYPTTRLAGLPDVGSS